MIEKSDQEKKKFEELLQEKIPDFHKINGGKITLGIFCSNDNDGRRHNVEGIFQTNSNFKVEYSKNFADAEKDVKNENFSWDHIDVFLVFSSGTPFPEWLGDFLGLQHKKGKGIVFGGNHTFHTTTGIKGEIATELPCALGEHIYVDNETINKKLIKVVEDHPILDGVKEFKGGNASYRVKIALTKPKSDNEEITLIGTWDDTEETPLIITKSNKDNNQGNMVILNFCPNSSSFSKSFWTIGGDIIIQNSIIWAANPYLQKKQEKWISENSLKMFELIKQIAPLQE